MKQSRRKRLPFHTKIEELRELKQTKKEEYWDKFKNLSFLEFNDKIGLPIKNGLEMPIFRYELELLESYESKKHIWIKKATGLGITEFTLRWIAWKCTKDNNFRDNQIDVSVVIITGPRIDLSIQEMDRLKGLFKDRNFDERNTICMINGAKIEAFPSHNLSSARGLNPRIVFLDEADFFPIGQQEEARVIAERYIPKTDPSIIMVSTPNLPGGLYEKIEKEEICLYERIHIPYTVGLRDGMFTQKEIDDGMQSPSFEREFNLQYGIGIGNIFPYDFVDACTQEYDLALGHGLKLITVDPAYGSSNFAVLGFEQIDGIIYVKEEIERERPSPAVMTELLVDMNRRYGGCLMLVDSAHPGLIRDLQDRGVNVQSVRFGAMAEDNQQSLISKMTFEAAQAIKEKRVRIHPSMRTLTTQLKSVRFNEKGHPDKKQLNFDTGDCFIMGTNHLKSNRVRIITVGLNTSDDDE